MHPHLPRTTDPRPYNPRTPPPARTTKPAVRPWHTGLTSRAAATVIRLSGHLDLLVSCELRQLLDHAAGRNPHIIVDLTEVQLIDSTALGALLGGRNNAITAGGDVCLVAPNSAVRALLATTRLDGCFPTFDTDEQAERWCRSNRHSESALGR